MVSRRKRANSSVGNKLNNLTDRVAEQQKLQQVSGTQTNAVTNDSIAPSSVNGESVADRAITSSKIGRGEVTSENLGVITEIVAGGNINIEAGLDGHVQLTGGKYEDPYDGITDGDGYQVVAFDPSDNSLKIIEASPPAESGLRFDTTYTEGSTAVGMLSWTDEFETLEFLADENVSIQIGQETVYRVKNASGSVAIPKFRLVMFAGATGDTVTVSPATATAIRDNPAYLVGITAEEIPAGDFGFVTHFGFITNVATDSYTLGDLLYLDPATTTGTLTATKPSAPFFDTPIAAVTRVQANSGRVLVRMDFGSKMGDLHDTQITSASEGQTLLYNSSGVWVNSNPPSQNYLINGGMDIWQRGTSFSADGYTADRWYFNETGVCTVSQPTSGLPSGLTYAMQLDSTGSGDSCDIYQALEEATVKNLRGKTMTFSCYILMDANTIALAGTFDMIVRYSNSTDARASQTTAVTTSSTHTTSVSASSLTKSLFSSWYRAVMTFTVPSDAVGLMVGFESPLTADPITTASYSITGAQLEEGSIATPFHRHASSIEGELAACQRYYYRYAGGATYSRYAFGSAVSTSVVDAVMWLPVTMRDTPTTVETSNICADTGAAPFTGGTWQVYAACSGPSIVCIRYTHGSAALTQYRPYYVQNNNNAAGYIAFTAEL